MQYDKLIRKQIKNDKKKRKEKKVEKPKVIKQE